MVQTRVKVANIIIFRLLRAEASASKTFTQSLVSTMMIETRTETEGGGDVMATTYSPVCQLISLNGKTATGYF